MSPTRAPGLIRHKSWPLQRKRMLSLPGQVLVQVGQRVAPTDLIAKAQLPGRIVPVNVAAALSLTPDEVPGSLVKGVGDSVQAGEVIANSSELFGLLRSECLAPCEGKVLSVSRLTGQVLLQSAAEPVAVRAYLGGDVVAVIPERGAVVSNHATFVQGVYGVGGEVWGELVAAVSEPEMDLTADRLDASLSGKVVLGGARVSRNTLAQAAAAGIVAIVTGSVEASDLAELVHSGWDAKFTGSATVSDKAPLDCTLVITEGFGNLAMQPTTFELLRACQGSITSVSGLTQLRAGVVRPEVVVPQVSQASPRVPDRHESPVGSAVDQDLRTGPVFEQGSAAWKYGDRVKVIRDPHLGRLGTVRELPSALVTLPSGVLTRVAKVELEGGETVLLALANLEPL